MVVVVCLVCRNGRIRLELGAGGWGSVVGAWWCCCGSGLVVWVSPFVCQTGGDGCCCCLIGFCGGV